MLFRNPQILATMVAKKTGFPVFFFLSKNLFSTNFDQKTLRKHHRNLVKLVYDFQKIQKIAKNSKST
jgi:hypothetical protein